MVSVSVGPAPTSLWGQLGSDGRQAPCEAEALVTPGCVSTAGIATSGKIHQHSAHSESRSLLFVLFIQSVHVPFPCFCSLMPSHLSSCFLSDSHSYCFPFANLLSSIFYAHLCNFLCSSALAHPYYGFILSESGDHFFPLAAFHSLTVLVLLYPRAKHISSIGHSQDQWRGKAQERLKRREGEEEGEGGVALWKYDKKERLGPFTECNSANMYVQSVQMREKESAKRFS